MQSKEFLKQGVQMALNKVPAKIKENEVLFLAVLIAVPFFTIYIIHLILLNMLGGLPAILFNIAVILGCMNYRPQKSDIDTYVKAQFDNDEQAISDSFFEVTNTHIETVTYPNSFMARSLVLQDIYRWFGVLFYFVLCGPAGAVIYSALQIVNKMGEEQINSAAYKLIQKILAVLDWPVSRLLALTFFLAGSFDDALKGWNSVGKYTDTNDPLIDAYNGEDSIANLHQGNQAVLLSTACASISHDPSKEEENDTAYVTAVRGLLGRSLIIWCAVIAVGSLFF